MVSRHAEKYTLTPKEIRAAHEDTHIRFYKKKKKYPDVMGKQNAAPWRPKRTERLLRGSVAHSFSSKTSFSVTKESKEEEEKRETRIADTQVRSLRPLAVILGHLPLVGGTA